MRFLGLGVSTGRITRWRTLEERDGPSDLLGFDGSWYWRPTFLKYSGILLVCVCELWKSNECILHVLTLKGRMLRDR